MLRNLLSRQRIDRERATGLVVGAGGLPYTLGYLGVSRVAVLDRNPYVITSVCSRVGLLKNVSSWGEYMDAVGSGLDERMRRSFQREFRIASQSGLRSDFATTGATVTEIIGQEGDVIDELPRLAEQCREEGRIVSFANVTNVGLCLQMEGDTSPMSGRRALAGLVRELPLSEDAVIVESGPGILRAQVRTAEEYLGRLAYH